MTDTGSILIDSFGRPHTYLRISLTERCNLRCTYCRPEHGIALLPKSHLMNFDEIYTIAKTFVDHGVTKIRLTGGEPLVRKDIAVILERLASLPVSLAITTNAVLADRYIDTFKKCGIRHINVSLDSLQPDKFKQITRRDYFERVYRNILLLVNNGFEIKLNVVLIKGFNDDEIMDFIRLTEVYPVTVRFIEFMPFDGNKWSLDKTVSYEEVMDRIKANFSVNDIIRLGDAPNDTSKNYKIKGYQGSFAIIGSVTNPFCDTCNRLRLTASGHIKNCLFSSSESDLLTTLRNGQPIEPVIKKAVQIKQRMRGGMDTLEKLKNPEYHQKNRSMIAIGG